MDGLTASLILEFVLRQPIEDWLAKEVLLRLPILSPLNPHLKKTLLVRRLSAADLSNDTLRSLELLEELDRTTFGATQTSEALKAAYSAVAAELTVAPLRSGSRDNFLEAVNCIWDCRVTDLERSEARGMMGEGLREWRRRMEEAVASDAARELLLRRDTRAKAVEALKEYVRVALKEMGPPLLELAACAVGGGGQPDTDGSEATHQGAEEREAIRMPGLSAEPSNPLGAATMELFHSHLDLPAPGTVAEDIPPVPEIERCKRSVLDGQAGISGQDRITEELDFMPLREVNKVKKALKSSCADLQKVVEDPLPNALARAVEIQNGMVEQSATPRDANNGQNKKDMDALGPSVGKDAQANVTLRTGAQNCNGIPCPTKPRRSLMDHHPTARTYEWDEDDIEVSSDNSPNASKRPHLPTPRSLRVSPVQLQKVTKFVRRRKIKRWTPQEEDALREAVKKHGKGNWKLILHSCPGAFEDRTEVDLKDKWRNLTR